jgi:hypothetical protein
VEVGLLRFALGLQRCLLGRWQHWLHPRGKDRQKIVFSWKTMLPTALTAVLAGALAAALATGLIGCITSFCLVPLQLLAQGDHCYGIVDEDVPTYSWIRNLLSIYCIQGLFLQSEQW